MSFVKSGFDEIRDFVFLYSEYESKLSVEDMLSRRKRPLVGGNKTLAAVGAVFLFSVNSLSKAFLHKFKRGLLQNK